MYRVLIVDDQVISRQLFEHFIENSKKYQLLYALDNAELADVYLARYSVDLILMDVVMQQGVSGLDAAERIKRDYPHIKIIIVTSMPEVSYIQRAKEIGVDSFWYKEVQETPLMEVLDRTMAGEHIFPKETPVLQIGYTNSKEFTDAELLVLRELTTGAGNHEIAKHLNISVNTVRSHIQHMLAKTGFDNRTELAIEARLSGIVISERK